MSGELIARMRFRSGDLLIPATGPPCKVLECPLELMSSPLGAPKHGGNANVTHTEVLSPTMTVFLEQESTTSSSKGDGSSGMCGSRITAVANAHMNEGMHGAIGADELGIELLEKVVLRVHGAKGLAPGARALDVFVVVRACGTEAGTTRVSDVGNTTSPEWIDEA